MLKKVQMMKEGKREEDNACPNGRREELMGGVMSYSYNQNAKGIGPPNAKIRNKVRYSTDDYGDEEEKKISRSNDDESPIGSDAEFS